MSLSGRLPTATALGRARCEQSFAAVIGDTSTGVAPVAE